MPGSRMPRSRTARLRIPRLRLLVRLGGCALLPVALTTPPQAAASVSPFTPAPGTVVFSDSFQHRDWGSPGARWCPYSSSYPDGRTNSRDRKLDRVTPAAVTVAKGGVRFRATPVTGKPWGKWATGLLTTERWDGGPCGGNGFMVRPGDYVLVRLRLPDRAGGGGHGAWPGVWTWRNGDNEIDILEWHGETPDRAEFVNHTGHGGSAVVSSRLLGFGKWICVGARLGADSVVWYLGDSPSHMRAVYRDRRGVPRGWRAYLVLNLSVSRQAGRTPTRLTPITALVSGVQVYRPSAQPRPTVR